MNMSTHPSEVCQHEPTQLARSGPLRLSAVFALAAALVTVARADSVTALGPEAFGGRTRSLVVVEGGPRSPEVLLAGSMGGGLWRSRDSGITWEIISELGHHSVTSIVTDPNAALTVYAGTGEVDQTLRGGGIYRSLDGGESWAHIAGTDVEELSFIRRLSVSADGLEVLAATSEGLFSSSTVNFQFRCVMPGPYGCSEPMSDVVFHPTDPDQALAATATTATVLFRDRSSGSLEWHESYAETKSDPQEKEVTWLSWEGSVALAYARADTTGNTVYASVDGASVTQPIWRSDNGGRLFKPRDGDLHRCVTHEKSAVQGLGGWANLIWAGHPQEQDFLILGRVDLWRSTDGGTSFTLLSDYDRHPESPHADHHVLATRSNFGRGSRQAWIGTDGGIFYTADLTASTTPCEPVDWAERNDGYSAAEFYAMTVLSNGILLGGAQDLGLIRRRPSAQCVQGARCWSTGHIVKNDATNTPVRDDIHAVLAHPTSAATAFALGNDLDVLRTTDSGVTWEYISDLRWNGTAWGRPPGAHWPVEDVTEDLGIPALALDSHQPPQLYLGAGCLYRTKDPLASLTTGAGRLRWQWVPAPIRKPRCESQPYLRAIKARQNAPADVWVCYDDGRVFRATDALTDQPSWQRVRGAPPSADGWACRSIEVLGDGLALVTLAGGQSPNVFYVRDSARGRDIWTPVTLPEDTLVYQVIAHPNDEQHLYAATEQGVLERDPSGSWRYVPGVPRQRTHSILLQDPNLYVATYGAGLYSVRIQPVSGGRPRPVDG